MAATTTNVLIIDIHTLLLVSDKKLGIVASGNNENFCVVHADSGQGKIHKNKKTFLPCVEESSFQSSQISLVGPVAFFGATYLQVSK